MAADLHDEIRQFRSEMDRAVIRSSMITKFAFFLLGLLAIAVGMSYWSGRPFRNVADLSFSGQDSPPTKAAAPGVAPTDEPTASIKLAALEETITATQAQLLALERQLANRGAPTNEHVVDEVKHLADKVALLEESLQAVRTAKPVAAELPLTVLGDQSDNAESDETETRDTTDHGQLIIHNKSDEPAVVYVNDVAFYVAVGTPVSITAPTKMALRLEGDTEIYRRDISDWKTVNGRREITFEIE